jgi:hypothetical protein
MSQLGSQPPPNQPPYSSPAGGSRPAPPAATTIPRPVHDQPPRVSANPPNFSIRDGVTYGFITDLDSETLHRLDTLDHSLSSVVDYTDKMGKAIHEMAVDVVMQTGALQQQQAQLHTDIASALHRLDALAAEVRDLRATILRYRDTQPGPAPTGNVIQGWALQALSGDRAWLKTPSGKVITVVRGERLPSLGPVQSVDTHRRIVVLADGRYIR